MNIYEQGDQYSAFGHVDPVEFRLKCLQDYNAKPVNIKHLWQKQVYDRQKRCYRLIKSTSQEPGSFEITTGEL